MEKKYIKASIRYSIQGVVIVFLITCLFACRYIEGGWHYYKLKSSMRTSQKTLECDFEVKGHIPILHLYGTPAEMGTQYGTILKDPLQRLFRCMKLFFEEEYSKELIAQAEVLEKNLPDPIRTELKAISRAADISYMELVTVNVTPRLMCSTLAVWGRAAKDGEMLMGRNSDYPCWPLEEILGLVVVYHPTVGNPWISVNFLGMVGAFTGMNEQDVSFGNVLVFNPEAEDDLVNEDGLPIQLLMRLAAQESNTAEKFIEYLKNKTHLIPMNVMAVDSKKAFLAEITNRKQITITESGTNYLVASNYFQSSALYSYPIECERYDSLVTSVRQNLGEFDLDTMKKALYDARIEDINVQAVIFQPSKMKIHISINKEPAAEGPYITFDVSELIKHTIKSSE